MGYCENQCLSFIYISGRCNLKIDEKKGAANVLIWQRLLLERLAIIVRLFKTFSPFFPSTTLG